MGFTASKFLYHLGQDFRSNHDPSTHLQHSNFCITFEQEFSGFQVNLRSNYSQFYLNFTQFWARFSLIFHEFIMTFHWFSMNFNQGVTQELIDFLWILSQKLARFSLNFIENGWILLSNFIDFWFWKWEKYFIQFSLIFSQK